MAILRLAMTSVPAGVAPAGACIIIEGNQRIDAERVRSYFHPAPHGGLDAAALEAAIKRCSETSSEEQPWLPF
jgi:outer membrane protein insertion porin family